MASNFHVVNDSSAAAPSDAARRANALSAFREAYELQQQQTKSQICFDFTKGTCLRGDKCKYSHDLDTIVTFNSKEKGQIGSCAIFAESCHLSHPWTDLI